GEEAGDFALTGRRVTGDDGPVNLAGRARPEHRAEMLGGSGSLGDDDATGGIAVEAMHEAWRFALGVRNALHDAIKVARGAAATLYGKAVRLVEDDDVIILVEGDTAQEAHVFFIDPKRLDRAGIIDGRDADDLAGGYARAGLRACLVDPHVAVADKLLQTPKTQLREIAR